MAADKELLKEVALELWNTTKKLRPGLPKAPRAQLVLKALLTIGDMSDQLEAAMVLGVIEAQEPDDEPGQGEAAGEDKTVSETDAKTELISAVELLEEVEQHGGLVGNVALVVWGLRDGKENVVFHVHSPCLPLRPRS